MDTKTGTHGITARSRMVRIPMEDGTVLDIEPKTNIVWVWNKHPHSDSGSDITALLHTSDLHEKEVK